MYVEKDTQCKVWKHFTRGAQPYNQSRVNISSLLRRISPYVQLAFGFKDDYVLTCVIAVL